MNFITGVVFGVVLATVGAHGVANYVDKGVSIIKHQAVQLNK
jgi:hypothetical protein